MKKSFQYISLVIYILIILAVFIPHLIHHTPSFIDKSKITHCIKSINSIPVQIKADGFHPKLVSGKLCDRVIIKNTDNIYHEVAFGPHPNHLIYPGFVERPLHPGEENNFILNAWGEYQLHDHLNEKLEATLNISK